MSFSSASFAAANPGGGKARLKKMLSCDASLTTKLGEGHQALLGRLKTVADKYEIVSLTVPDFAAANMGISVATFYAELVSLAGQILETRQPRNVSELDLILTRLEVQLAMALSPKSFKPDPRIPNKARMETRMFDEDWNTMYPQPQDPKQILQDLPPGDYGQVSDMPMGPHDFNRATESGRDEAEKEQRQNQQQQQQRQQTLMTPGHGRTSAKSSDVNDFRPWDWNDHSFPHANWPPREKP